MVSPADLAQQIISIVMNEGSAKDGNDDAWKEKPSGFHRLKAIRHLINAEMIERGDIPDDGEPHDQNALTRQGMEIWKKLNT